MEYWKKKKSFSGGVAWNSRHRQHKLGGATGQGAHVLLEPEQFEHAVCHRPAQGLFCRGGMDVEMIQVNPRLGATALLNGDIDFTATFGSTLRGIVGGFPIKFVAVSVKKSEHFFDRQAGDQRSFAI